MMRQFSITTLIVEGLQTLYPYIHLMADVFIMVCLVVGLWATYQALHHRNGNFPYLAATVLTSLGMFSTFFVLFVGLSVFDGQEIKNTLPLFLEGIKIAIIISIIAGGSNILLRIMGNKVLQEKTSNSKGVTPTMVYLVLREISDHNVKQKAILSTMAAQANEHQQNIQKVLDLQQSGLANVVTGLEHLSEEFRTLANQVSGTSVPVLIQSIEKTVQGSNETITEYFEEKFKPIHQTTNLLLGWQEQVRKINENFSQSVAGIEKSREALQQIVIHTQSLPQTITHLTKSLQGLHQQVEETELHLQHLHRQSREAFPTIEKNLNGFMQKMQSEIQCNLDIVEISLETQLDMAESSLASQLEGFTSLQENFTLLENQTEKWRTEMDEVLSRFSTVIHQYTKEVSEKMRKTGSHHNRKPSVPLQPSLPNEESVSFGEEDDWQHQGHQLMETGRYDEAIAYFDKAIELRPKEFSPFYNKACCYALKGRVEPATIALRQAIALNPECQDIAKTDPDFDHVRHDPKFQFLLINGILNGGSS